MKQRSYTPEEDEIILSAGSSHEAHRKLSGRTFLAVKQRKYVLTHPEPEPTRIRPKFSRVWTKPDEKLLRRIWPAAKTTDEVMRQLPGYTRTQIQSKAGHLKVKRWFNGAADVPVQGHKELIDQIRIRSKQDGIAFCKLDKLLGCGCYFGSTNSRRHRINLVIVARAIDFFGGTLVIDWCDR